MLDDYRVKMPIRTRFGDTDMLGYVNTKQTLPINEETRSRLIEFEGRGPLE